MKKVLMFYGMILKMINKWRDYYAQEWKNYIFKQVTSFRGHINSMQLNKNPNRDLVLVKLDILVLKFMSKTKWPRTWSSCLKIWKGNCRKRAGGRHLKSKFLRTSEWVSISLQSYRAWTDRQPGLRGPQWAGKGRAPREAWPPWSQERDSTHRWRWGVGSALGFFSLHPPPEPSPRAVPWGHRTMMAVMAAQHIQPWGQEAASLTQGTEVPQPWSQTPSL